MLGRAQRDRDAIAVDLVGVAGLCAFVLGLAWLQGSEKIGFELADAIAGVASQLSVTVPAAVLILGASALELGTGLVLARLARRSAFDSYAEALLAAMVVAVLKDTFLLGTLAAAGLFLQPVLLLLDAAILAAALAMPAARTRTRPLLGARPWREATADMGPPALAALVAMVWVGPIVLQLASPVVPFIDVLPNYVGPVEHLRTFGWFSPLSATQSPIIGPSRTVLGYDGFMGALATMTNLPGGLAIAGFILPQTVLVAAGAHRLASALRTGPTAIGTWALLAFGLSQPFARLADARGTVVVAPLVLLGLAVAADALRERHAHDGAHPTSDDAWRVGRGVIVGLALGAAIYVHPVIGFFAVATVAIAGLVRPERLAVPAFVATLAAGLLAVPQAATMAGLSLPTVALGAWLPPAVAAGLLVDRFVSRGPGLQVGLIRLATIARWTLLVGGAVAVAVAFSIGALQAERISEAWEDDSRVVLESSGLLLIALGTGIVLGSRGARSPLVLAGLAVGVVAVAVVAVLPGNLGFLGDALRFEVPKTVFYWLSMIAAAGAAAALAHVAGTGRQLAVWPAAALAIFVMIAALPLRPKAIDAYHLGEHRFSETFAIDLRFAGSGFWVGFPDTRTVVDAPRRELLDALRVEIAAGRLRHDTPVLHVAETFQQWSSTPLGVFAGVFETSISLEPEVGHQTVGGRLLGVKDDPVAMLDQLGGLLASRAYPYVVLEPQGLPEGARTLIESDGYAPIFGNGQGTVYRLGG